MFLKASVLAALPLSMLIFSTNVATAQTFEQQTLTEAEQQCNESVSYAQQCQKQLNQARLMGFKDILQYLHFVQVVEVAAAKNKPIVDIAPLSKTDEFIQASQYMVRGEAIPSELEASIELTIKQRQELLARTLGVEPEYMEARLDSYKRYNEFLIAQSQLEATRFVTLDIDWSNVEIIETTASIVDSWGSSSMSVKLGATALIESMGIDHPSPFLLTVVIVVTDEIEPRRHTFKYRESTGAIAVGNGWQACPDCPIGLQPD